MNKTDLENLNGYLYETFKNRVRLNENLDIEINYNTRLNTNLNKQIIIPEKEKLTINSFYIYLTNKSLIDLINFYLNEFEKIERNELKEKIKKTKL
jgi:hypothetical protein